MKVITTADYGEMSDVGFELMKDVIKNTPDATLGLATGTTPLGLYDRLVGACCKKEISFKKIKTVNLDEYVGLGANDRQSYVYFMREHLFGRVDIDLKNTYLPDGLAADFRSECVRYDGILNAHPQSIQLLGLGRDGHIGFNEPGAPFDGHTHIVRLTETTVADNSRLFGEHETVPGSAITMGIADIMRAKRILMLVSGENKKQAVYDMIKGPVTEDCPASVLQRHPDVTVVLDRAAAGLL